MKSQNYLKTEIFKHDESKNLNSHENRQLVEYLTKNNLRVSYLQ
jgi:hypothetical protein